MVTAWTNVARLMNAISSRNRICDRAGRWRVILAAAVQTIQNAIFGRTRICDLADRWRDLAVGTPRLMADVMIHAAGTPRRIAAVIIVAAAAKTIIHAVAVQTSHTATGRTCICGLADKWRDLTVRTLAAAVQSQNVSSGRTRICDLADRRDLTAGSSR